MELLSDRPVFSFPAVKDSRLRRRFQDMNWVMTENSTGKLRLLRLWRTGTIDHERDFFMSTVGNSPHVRGLRVLPVPRVPSDGADDEGKPGGGC